MKGLQPEESFIFNSEEGGRQDRMGCGLSLMYKFSKGTVCCRLTAVLPVGGVARQNSSSSRPAYRLEVARQILSWQDGQVYRARSRAQSRARSRAQSRAQSSGNLLGTALRF